MADATGHGAARDDGTSGAQEGGQDESLTLVEAVELAIRLHRAGDLDGADRLYRGVLALAPDMPVALHFGGLLRASRGQEEGLAQVRRSLDLSPQEAGWWGNLAEALLARGDEQGAEAAFRRGVETAPDDGAAYARMEKFLTDRDRISEVMKLHAEYVVASRARRHLSEVGRALLRLDRRPEAAKAFRRWLADEPDNPVAAHMLATASGDAPSRCADAYVEIAFDAYAERFDDHIRSLDYRGPGLIAGAMAAAYGAPAGTLDIVDLGCGTGLCAPALRPYARRLDGVDLSEAMLERARALGLYDSLAHGELTAFVEGLPPRSCDVAASGDTLCYFGDLAPVFTAAAAALRPGGRLIATLEATSSSAPRELGPSGRYRHGEAFARAEAERAGLTVETVRAEKLRDEGGGPVAGWLLALRRG